MTPPVRRTFRSPVAQRARWLLGRPSSDGPTPDRASHGTPTTGIFDQAPPSGGATATAGATSRLVATALRAAARRWLPDVHLIDDPAGSPPWPPLTAVAVRGTPGAPMQGTPAVPVHGTPVAPVDGAHAATPVAWAVDPIAGGASATTVDRATDRSIGGAVDGAVQPVAPLARRGDRRPPCRVVVHDRRAYAALARRGSIGLGESYVAGWWDTDDLVELVRHLTVATGGLRRPLDRAGRVLHPVLALASAPDALRRRMAPQRARSVDRAEVQAHYDLPHELFAAMLDETMAYSCAVFDRPDATLADAQRAKFDRLCRKLRLGPTDHLVEIGTGWGGFAVHAAATTGCRVTTTTVSAAQRDAARARVRAEGLEHQVTVLDVDYRDLTGRFDALVSIEMVEAVDWRDHPTYLRTCRRLLRADGRAALQAIVLDDQSEPRARHHADLIRALVFPGSCIPSVSRLVGLAARAGLRTVDVEDIGRHYAETLHRWRANLAAAVRRGSVGPAGAVDAALLRLWDVYLAYCEAAFLERHVSDVQIVLAAEGWRDQLDTHRR